MRTLALLCSVLLSFLFIGVASPEPASAMMSARTGHHAVDVAKSRIGSRYVAGGTGPRSFDCSGLTQWVFKHVGRSLPRVSRDQARRGHAVSRSHARPGDLVAFYSHGGVYHVGIYVGHGRVLHASRPGKPIGIDKIWTSSVMFRRL